MRRKYKQTEFGSIPEDWELRIVKEVCEINTSSIGKDYPYEEIEYIDITSVDKGTILESKKIKLNDAPSRAKRIVKDNDIILSTVRPNLKHFAFIKNAKPNLVVSTGFAVITCTNIVPQYLYYFLTTDSYTNYLSTIAEGHTSAYPAINPDVIENSIVPCPTIKEQQIIAKILSDFDAKIELNRQINQTLEQIAQAIFKCWFVDFDPVKAKIEAKEKGENPERAAMCTISGKTEEYLDKLPPAQLEELSKTAALFPDELVESEIGLIPKGWRVQSFTDDVDVIGGGTPKTSNPEYWGGDILWFSVVDTPAPGEVFVISTEKTITKDGLNNSSTQVLPAGTTIISARGTVGNLALVGVPMAMNQSCYGLHDRRGELGYYLYFSTDAVVKTLRQRTHGSVFNTITRDTLNSVRVVAPPDIAVYTFERIVSGSLMRILSGLHESRILAEIRDALLPKLLSGDINITEHNNQHNHRI